MLLKKYFWLLWAIFFGILETIMSFNSFVDGHIFMGWFYMVIDVIIVSSSLSSYNDYKKTLKLRLDSDDYIINQKIKYLIKEYNFYL